MPAVWQSGVIPYRINRGKIEVLLITTSSGKHWVIPKGWIPPWMTSSSSAAKEALEEAGVTGTVITPAIGRYSNQKLGYSYQIEVFSMRVEEELKTYPEAKRRQRQWMSPSQAVKKVRSPELKRLLMQFRESYMNGE